MNRTGSSISRARCAPRGSRRAARSSSRGAPRGDERVLGRDEERVQEHERERRHEAMRVDVSSSPRLYGRWCAPLPGRGYWAVARRPLRRGSIGDASVGLAAARAALERRGARGGRASRRPRTGGPRASGRRRRAGTRPRSRVRGSSPSARGRPSSRSRWWARSCARPPGRVGDRLAVARERERRLERDRLLERGEVVAERVGPALAARARRSA